jgi:hypothetical protein
MLSWLLLLLLVLVLAPTFLHAAPLEDLIEHLPGYGRPPTTQFSGFLDATAGCDTSVNGKFCKIHYWLNLADTENPMKAPVVEWWTLIILRPRFVARKWPSVDECDGRSHGESLGVD